MDILRVLFLVTSLVATATSAPVPLEVIDLSYDLDNTTIHWPSLAGIKLTPFEHIPWLLYDTEALYVESLDISSSEHMGTHMDAPSHLGKGQLPIDKIPIERLVGYAVVVNMSAKAAKDPDAQLAVSDLEAWEREHGTIPEGAIFLLNTGWGRKYWGDATKYMGGDGKNASNFHFPGIHIDALEWLVKNRKMKAYGIDCMSTDYARTHTYPVHRFLAANNIPGIENAAHLDKLPAKGAFVFAAPMKIKGGSGAPIRLLATISKQPQTCGAVTAGSHIAILSFFVSMATMLSMFV